VWNKVYRRSFWNSAQLEFWSARYEDIPVTIRAYVLARSVDIHREIVYYWRARESGDLSRNQKSRERANVEGRMAAVLEASGIIARYAPALKPAFDRRVLDNDLAILLRTVEFSGKPDQERLLELGARYLSSVDESVFRDADALARLHYHLMRESMHAELLEVMRYSRRGDDAKAPLVRLGRLRRKWYIGYPYLADPPPHGPAGCLRRQPRDDAERAARCGQLARGEAADRGLRLHQAAGRPPRAGRPDRRAAA
ncbi:MAG TPA: hypothetical protein VGJ54_06865, partial [Streptosporangiaceae bacterium]